MSDSSLPKISTTASSGIEDFLFNLKLEQYIPIFEEREIDINVALELTDDDLKDIGLSSTARKKFLQATKLLRANQEK